jgi:PAS domain S-box-containing protein
VEVRPELFNHLVAFAPEPMVIADERGIVVFANDAAHRLIGYPGRELIGRILFDLIHIDERPRLRDTFERALVSFELTPAIQCRIRAQDVRWNLIEWRLRSVRDGHSHFVLAYMRDIGASRQLEERLRHAQKLNLLGRLAVGVAEDFEQVVTTIRGHLPSIFELTAGQPASLSLHAILKATERAGSLTRQLRAFYETTPLLLERTDVHALLSDVRRLTTEDEWLKVTLGATRTTVRTDWAGLVLGLRDLILAFRHTPAEQAVVAVETSSPPPAVAPVNGNGPLTYVIVEVTNNGGMRPLQDTHLFERSFLTLASGGVMLALVTLDDIVTRSGGFIEVGTKDNRATAARVFLPVD